MEKFSLYDLLGLLLPGVLFIFFIGWLNNLYMICSLQAGLLGWEINIGVLLCFALITGAILYVSSHMLIKTKWYNKLFGLYKNPTQIYLNMEDLHNVLNEALNTKAKDWYGMEIFFSKDKYTNLEPERQDEIKDLQDMFYTRMYYELEYECKYENAKAFQSFYYFFRQIVLACLVLLCIFITVHILSLFTFSGIQNPETTAVLQIVILLFGLLLVSNILARWYRRRMMRKMYWTYYTHLSLTSNN